MQEKENLRQGEDYWYLNQIIYFLFLEESIIIEFLFK